MPLRARQIGRLLPWALAAAALACGEALPALERGGQPNLLLVVIDDMGMGDVGCYGSPDALTPRLDALAAEGVRCSQFYVMSPVCSPSRASLLTGRTPDRHGLDQSPGHTDVQPTRTRGFDHHRRRHSIRQRNQKQPAKKVWRKCDKPKAHGRGRKK